MFNTKQINHLQNELSTLKERAATWDNTTMIVQENQVLISKLIEYSEQHLEERELIKTRLEDQNKILSSICTNVSSMLAIVSFVAKQKNAIETIRKNILWLAPLIGGTVTIIVSLAFWQEILHAVYLLTNH